MMAKKDSTTPSPASLGQQGHGHNGTEQAFTRLLVGQLRGESGSDSGLHANGGTMNHIGLYRTSGYAFSAPLGRPALVDYLRAQVDQGYEAFAGHLAYGGRNEINTSSHWAWHGFWAGAAWLLALRRGDAEVLPLIRSWWRHELALQALGAGPKGDVELPCSRDWHYAADKADQRNQRNVCRAIILGHAGRVPRTAGSVEGGPLSTDMACVWVLMVLRKEFPREMAEVVMGDKDLPVLWDPMFSIHNEGESVIWFEVVTGGMDVCWWVHRRQDGSLGYGAAPGAQRGLGGIRPASVPERPALPGTIVKVPGRAQP